MKPSPTLSVDGCRTRRETLLAKVDADLMVLTDPRHVFYYGNFRPVVPSLAAWGPGYLLIDGKSGESTLLVHNFAADDAETAFVDHREIWTWYDASRRSGVSLYPAAAEKLAGAIVKRAPKKIGIERGWFPSLKGIEDVESVDITGIIEAQRRVKGPDELDCIRYVQDVALAGHQAARRGIRPGMTEWDLYALIQSAMTKRASRPVELICDLVTGPRTQAGVGGPTDRVIEEKDTVILDLNPVVGGYRSDYTATLVLDPNPGDRMQRLERALHAALDAGAALLKPGEKARDVYRAVQSCLEDEGFGDHFRHHAGHGLGLGHPEAPYFVPESNEVLREGDVVTLEPGAYGDDFAGRIEHVFLVTQGGPERLSRHDTRFQL